MPAYQDKKKGNVWRFRKLITLLDGTKKRISGTPEINSKTAAEAAERAEIDRWLHPEKAAARAQLAEEQAPKGEAPTFKAYAAIVIATYRPRRKRKGAETSDRTRAILINGPLMRFFGPFRMDKIDQALIDTAIKGWSGADQTINNRLSALSVVLRHYYKSIKQPLPELDLHVESRTIDEGSDEIDAVPLADVSKLLATASDKRHAFPYWVRAAVLLAAEAGLRIGEIRAAQWTDINKGNVLTVRRSLSDLGNLGPPKNGKSRDVPLSRRLIAELAKLPRNGFNVLTRDSKKHAGKALRYKPMLNTIKRLYKLAGVRMPKADGNRDRPWHGLRHTFGTTLAAANVPAAVIMELMGHADIRTTMLYINPDPGHMSAAIAEAFG